MSVLQAEVYEVFRSIDVPDDKALKAAVALSAALGKVEDETAKAFDTRDADIDATRKDVQSLKVGHGSVEMDGRLWTRDQHRRAVQALRALNT